jgi:N-acetylglucosamine-6-phosphate deacetylase
MASALVNGRVLTTDGFRDDVAVVVAGDCIAGIVPRSDGLPDNVSIHDLKGASLLPGFIDCQVNGGGGVLFNDAPTVDTLRTIASAHRRFGTTGLLPTLISDDAARMRAALAAVRDAIAQGVPGVLGIHLEGPYLAPTRKGAHDAAMFRMPGEDDIALLSAPGAGRTVLTLAPECVPMDVLRSLASRGVILCAGHSAATYEQARAGLEAGVRGFTHLYNAMSPLQGREPGMVGAALEDRGSWCGIIIDGHHVHPGSVRVALSAKPRGKVFLVTDAMPPVGATQPTFALYGETITAIDGVCRNAAGALAGSALDMATAVRNTVHMIGLPLEEAARMASTYPAEFLGLSDTVGRIAPGLRADLVAMDGDLQVQSTWIGGARDGE